MKRHAIALWAALLGTCGAGAATAGASGPQDKAPILLNPSFESGKDAPDGWKLVGGAGEWTVGGAEGKRAVAVTGRGNDSSFWRSGAIALKPATLYRLRFLAREVAASGGTPISGPDFCNVDLGDVPADWTPYEYSFVTPENLKPEDAFLRFGQWYVKGTVAFDDVRLYPAIAVYARQGDLVLGEGESVQGLRYTFEAPLGGDGRNHSRLLAAARSHFNSNRWVFGAGSEVVYRHQVAGRTQTAATVDVSVGWYASGQLAVEASRDGRSWRPLGAISGLAGRAFTIPKDLLPAEAVWVRLRSQAKARVGGNSDPGSLQVYEYRYAADLEGPPASLRGQTRYLAVVATDDRLNVTVDTLGEALPGGRNVLIARVENPTGKAIAGKPRVEVSGESGAVSSAVPDMTFGPGTTTVRVQYTVPGVGLQSLAFLLGPGIRFCAATSFRVPELHDSSYGEILGASTDQAALWWASSGWKISRIRSAPTAKGEAIRISAARNEAEAAQLVVRPSRPLKGFLAGAGALAGPGGATIPAENVQILRVRYVEVTQPTDATGVAGPWPDPLPPFAGGIDLAAERNQPLWVRVKVPRNAPAGVYKGTVKLTADGYEAAAPLAVEVFDFTLPDRMTCRSAFGLSPGDIWRYQKVTDPAQRRVVLDKYLRSFGEHHISPYDPAPLDPFRVTWEGQGSWSGGRRDEAIKHAGKASLRVEDTSETAAPSASYAKGVPIPAGGLRIRLWHRAEKGHPFLVTLNHDDASGQWMSGRNLDMRLEGTGDWAEFDRTVKTFPKDAASVRLTLWPALWAEDGSTTGTVCYDDVSLQDAGTGKELIEGGDFEPARTPPQPKFDFSDWDKAMAKAMGEYHFNSFSVPIQGMGGGTFHERHEPSLLGYGEDTPEYKAAFTAYCRTLQEHLRAKGWLGDAFVYWFDEPDPKDYEFVTKGFLRLKAAAPDLARMLTEQVEPALIGGPSIWCPVSPNYDHAAAEKRRAHGERFWWYVCCGPKAPYCTLFIDHPATELRVWLWQTWQRKIEAVLVWQTNYWTSSCAYLDPAHPQNPYEDPMGWVSGYSTPAGAKRPWGNGDGRFIYPPEAAADANPAGPVLDGPVDSIRWEMLRDGIEDYEYLAMLQRLLDKHEGKLAPGERLRLRGLLAVPAEITSDMTTFTKNPAPIERHRRAVARAIEKLSK